MNEGVDNYIERASIWKDELQALQNILLSCNLTEELKWGKPAYLHNGKIIVVVQAFKSYFALLFYKGYLLKDHHKVLQAAGPNSKQGKQMRFNTVNEIIKQKKVIREYISEAVGIESAVRK